MLRRANGWRCRSVGAHGRAGQRATRPIGATKDSVRTAATSGSVRFEVIEGGEDSALEFVDELKLDLFNEEVYVFTPNGDLIVGKGATALDFAFRVHTQVGQKCIGAKVNKKLSPSAMCCRVAIRSKS